MNYQIVLDNTLKEIIESGKRPKLLLHVCCAPCSSYVLEYLNKYFDITVFYYNPNISSEEEYKNVTEIESKLGTKVDLIVDGGEIKNTLASTIISIEENKIKVIREGTIKINE